MQTKISAPGSASLEEAAKLIKDGQIVAIPTETVYGLAADCLTRRRLKKYLKPRADRLTIDYCTREFH